MIINGHLRLFDLINHSSWPSERCVQLDVEVGAPSRAQELAGMENFDEISRNLMKSAKISGEISLSRLILSIFILFSCP